MTVKVWECIECIKLAQQVNSVDFDDVVGKNEQLPCEHAGAGVKPNQDNSCPICGGYCIPF